MKKKIIISAIVIVVVAGVVALRISSANRHKFVAVKAVKASVGDVKSYLSTTATIISKNVKDYYGVQAKVLQVNVKVGDKVKKGEVLITYDVQNPQVQVNQAQIAYNNAVSQKNDAIETNNQNAAKISDLNIDSQLNDYNSRLSTLNNEINSLENEVNTSKNSNTINNDKVLLYGAQQQSTSTNKISTTATPNIIPGQGGYYAQRDNLVSTINQLKNQKSQLQPMSTEKLSQLDNAVQNAKIALDNAKLNAGKTQTNITADFDGVVTSLNAEEGSMGNPGAIAVTIQDMNNLQGVVMLGKYDATKVQLNDSAIISNGVKDYNGKVTFIAPSASKSLSTTTGDNTLETDVDITDNPEGLKLAFDEDISILLGEKDGVIKIPAESIKTDKSGRNYVYVIENNKAVEKTVHLGLQSDTDAEILDGVAQGDKLISNPSASIQNGTLVKEK